MTIEAVLRSHLVRYPSMQIQDMYKLIHQAALGSEHAIASADGARQWLQRELTQMGSGPEESLIDPISPDGQIVRVHLRPFVAQGGDPEALLNAFIRTANEFHGSQQVLNAYWKAAVELQQFPSPEMNEFIESMRLKKYPAVHHSADYESLYRPAYRVMYRTYFL
ncbi:MAG TPA: hypothetical protein VFR47_27365 [Anaerolineales bacterium]|nr:hypothetical protein [Anaerolineales bacterium]